jgi:hypothetical protein
MMFESKKSEAPFGGGKEGVDTADWLATDLTPISCGRALSGVYSCVLRSRTKSHPKPVLEFGDGKNLWIAFGLESCQHSFHFSF